MTRRLLFYFILFQFKFLNDMDPDLLYESFVNSNLILTSILVVTYSVFTYSEGLNLLRRRQTFHKSLCLKVPVFRAI